jgi:hypothetical protein
MTVKLNENQRMAEDTVAKADVQAAEIQVAKEAQAWAAKAAEPQATNDMQTKKVGESQAPELQPPKVAELQAAEVQAVDEPAVDATYEADTMAAKNKIVIVRADPEWIAKQEADEAAAFAAAVAEWRVDKAAGGGEAKILEAGGDFGEVATDEPTTEQNTAATKLQSKARQKNAKKEVEAKKEAKQQEGAATALQSKARQKAAVKAVEATGIEQETSIVVAKDEADQPLKPPSPCRGRLHPSKTPSVGDVRARTKAEIASLIKERHCDWQVWVHKLTMAKGAGGVRNVRSWQPYLLALGISGLHLNFFKDADRKGMSAPIIDLRKVCGVEARSEEAGPGVEPNGAEGGSVFALMVGQAKYAKSYMLSIVLEAGIDSDAASGATSTCIARLQQMVADAQGGGKQDSVLHILGQDKSNSKIDSKVAASAEPAADTADTRYDTTAVANTTEENTAATKLQSKARQKNAKKEVEAKKEAKKEAKQQEAKQQEGEAKGSCEGS